MSRDHRTKIQRGATFLLDRLGRRPDCGVILGSGLGPIVEMADPRESVPYKRIPGMFLPRVKGHSGKLSWGRIGPATVAFFEGRFHGYEGWSQEEVASPVALLAEMGVLKLVLTTSVGAVNLGFKAGEIMLIRDHINLMGDNPLFGLPPWTGENPFLNLSRCYSDGARKRADRIARKAGLRVRQGVLAGVKGPVYETPAEVRMLRKLGADAVCMSTVPEAILASFFRMETVGICFISNSCDPSSARSLSHGHVVRAVEKSLPRLRTFLKRFLSDWASPEKGAR